MRSVLIVCGLGQEARVAAGQGVITVPGGGVRAVLEERLHAVPRDGIAAIVSFGLAGALDPSLRAGDVLVPDDVRSLGGGAWVTAPEIRERWSRLSVGRRDVDSLQRGASVETPLRGAPQDEVRAGGEPRSTHAGPRRADRPLVSAETLLGVDAPILGVAEKAQLRGETGAVAIDMESHVAAGYAADRGLPFAVLRVVSDGAGHALPAVAGAAMRPDGSVDVLGVLAGVARDPRQIPALLATARDGARAFRALRRVRGLLGPGFGLHL